MALVTTTWRVVVLVLPALSRAVIVIVIVELLPIGTAGYGKGPKVAGMFLVWLTGAVQDAVRAAMPDESVALAATAA